MTNNLINLLAKSIEVPVNFSKEKTMQSEYQNINSRKKYIPQKICNYKTNQLKKDNRKNE